jgi:hypothetical protein
MGIFSRDPELGIDLKMIEGESGPRMLATVTLKGQQPLKHEILKPSDIHNAARLLAMAFGKTEQADKLARKMSARWELHESQKAAKEADEPEPAVDIEPGRDHPPRAVLVTVHSRPDHPGHRQPGQ